MIISNKKINILNLHKCNLILNNHINLISNLKSSIVINIYSKLNKILKLKVVDHIALLNKLNVANYFLTVKVNLVLNIFIINRFFKSSKKTKYNKKNKNLYRHINAKKIKAKNVKSIHLTLLKLLN